MSIVTKAAIGLNVVAGLLASQGFSDIYALYGSERQLLAAFHYASIGLLVMCLAVNKKE